MALMKRRTCLKLEDNLKVIQYVEKGRTVNDITRELGIGKTQVYTLYKKRDSLLASVRKSGVPKHSKKVKNSARYPDIDAAVFEWFCGVRTLRSRKPLPVSQDLIKARAMLEAKKKGIQTFKASNGWFWKWRNRYNITPSVTLHGEAGDIDLKAAEQKIQILREALHEFRSENIFNMDESALFYKAIPRRSYLMEDEGDKRQAGRGTKAMKCKDRITIILCVNSTGSCKLNPVVIGSAKKPRCFKYDHPVLPYFNQKNAWNDTVNYRKWWYEIFLPRVREWTSEPVALVIDGFSGHDMNCFDPLKQVTVFKFPPNVTSIYQPLDQGIIATLKAGYKSRVLASLVGTIEGFDQLQVLADQLPTGCAGLKYGRPPHIADAIYLLKEAWNDVSPTVIAACWKHSQCLSAIATSDTMRDGHDYCKTIGQSAVSEMCKNLSSLCLTEHSLARVGIDIITQATDVHDFQGAVSVLLDKWLHLEESGMICDDSEWNESEEDTIELPEPVVKLNLIKNAMMLLSELHGIGVRIGDGSITTAAREFCNHIQESLSSLSSLA